MPRYYEDFEVGETMSFGSRTVTESDIISFAERYDPQPLHIDPNAAAETMYGGLIASGWHTAALTMRMIVDGYFDDLATVGGRGVNELRWVRPVRPGDTLSVEIELADKTARKSEWGTFHNRTVTHNGDGDPVMSMLALVMVTRRDGDAGAG